MRKKPSRKKTKNSGRKKETFDDILSIHTELANLKTALAKVIQDNEENKERLQDAEIHINLLTRLLTTLCVEKFRMRVGVLKRLIKRVENEAIRDSQIDHLEFLYRLSKDTHSPDSAKKAKPEDDPWEDIS